MEMVEGNIETVRAEFQKWITYCIKRLVENGASLDDITEHSDGFGEFAPMVIKVQGEPIVRVVLYAWQEGDKNLCQVEVQERKWEDE